MYHQAHRGIYLINEIETENFNQKINVALFRHAFANNTFFQLIQIITNYNLYISNLSTLLTWRIMLHTMFCYVKYNIQYLCNVEFVEYLELFCTKKTHFQMCKICVIHFVKFGMYSNVLQPNIHNKQSILALIFFLLMYEKKV